MPITYFKIFQQKSIYQPAQIDSLKTFLKQFEKTPIGEILSVCVFFDKQYNNQLYDIFKQYNTVFVTNNVHAKHDYVYDELISGVHQHFSINKCQLDEHTAKRYLQNVNSQYYVDIYPVLDLCSKTQLVFWEDQTITHCVLPNSPIIGNINQGPFYQANQRNIILQKEQKNQLKCYMCTHYKQCARCAVNCEEN